MDINALLEAFQDFETRGKKEDLPLLEQFLGHVAKTGQPLIPWTEFKSYFIFKLESIMDDFNASTPEQRPPHNPNVEYVPFEEMKQRILKIVDGYNGIPFTIQRLCELLTDPKRNYTGSEKFLRGLEKNVMVVSCVYPTTEKNGGSNVNRMNGVMFPGNSLYSDSRNVNGPSTPKPLARLRLSLSSSLSTNGLSECIVSKESESTTEKAEHQMSDSDLSVDEPFSNNRLKNKHLEEVGEEECLDRHEVKRLKSEKEEDDAASEEKKSESLSETVESYGEEYACDTSCEIPAISKNKEPCNTATETCEKQESSSETEAPQRGIRDTTVDQQEKATFSEKSTVLEKNNEEGFERSGDEEGLTIQNAVSSSSNTSDLTTDGDADYSNSMQTENNPGEQDRK